MFESGWNSEPPHRLQLEFAGGGPGSGMRTSIGAGSNGDNEIDRRGLDSPPWWFVFLSHGQNHRFRDIFGNLSLERALNVLEKAGVPPLYRLGLGLRWGFIDPERDGFSASDFYQVYCPWSDDDDLPKSDYYYRSMKVKSVLDLIESRAVFKLWRFGKLVNQMNNEFKNNDYMELEG